MRLSTYIPVVLTFFAAVVLSLITANFSVSLIEERSEIGVRDVLDSRELTWAEVSADGLQVTLAGIAPTEALRFSALSAAGSIVDAARVIDDMQVEAQAAIAPPRFSAEILRNDSGISVIGLLPAQTDREDLRSRFADLVGEDGVTDLLEVADYPVPARWDDALAYALSSLKEVPRAKVSVEAGRVSITALADSEPEKARLERRLTRAAPPGLNVSLIITAPRPVLTPFTLRFIQDEDGIRFDACSADSNKSRDRIIQAAFAAGLTGSGQCQVGMGVPTPRWAEAVEMAIAAVAELGGGSVTFSDADVALRALEGTNPAVFDNIVGELENRLPDVFALTAVLPRPENPDEGPSEFVATLSPEGLVQLRGRVGDEASRELATSYAQSLFGSTEVHSAARVVDGLPQGWPLRVLTGLEALGNLSNGAVVVTPDAVSITGNTGNPQANAKIAQMFASKLGEAGQYDLRVTYQKKLDPVAGLPTPEECESEIGAIQTARKITFEPSSASIDADAIGTMNDIADVLKRCGDLKMEISGHTDSQGRTEMNLSLSQERAQSILNELRDRDVLTARFTAKGYGESKPVEDNGTESGREANRRIEFRLIRPAPTAPEQDTTLDTLAEEGAEPSLEQTADDTATEQETPSE
ncbi:MAG: OmpA family protein [Aliishimia sp.]